MALWRLYSACLSNLFFYQIFNLSLYLCSLWMDMDAFQFAFHSWPALSLKRIWDWATDCGMLRLWVSKPAWTLPLMTYAISYIHDACVAWLQIKSLMHNSRASRSHWVFYRMSGSEFKSVSCFHWVNHKARQVKLVPALHPDFMLVKEIIFKCADIATRKNPSLYFRRTFKCLFFLYL